MSNINKILITIVACVFMISAASVGIVSIVTSDKKEAATTTTAPANITNEADTQASLQTPATQQNTTTQPPVSTSAAPQSTTTTAPSTSAAQGTTGDLSKDILGKWMDSAGMSGWEFIEGGKVNWTYVDLEQFSVPFNGKTSGVYTLEGDTLTVKFSIYSATIKKVYRVKVSGNELSMYDFEEFETSTYIREA